MITQRLHIGDVQKVGHYAACRAATTRSHGNALFSTEVDKIPDNEKIGIIAHIVNDFQFKLQTLTNGFVYHRVALRQGLLAQIPQIACCIEALGHREFGQQQMPKL